jgi:hypothetical protein
MALQDDPFLRLEATIRTTTRIRQPEDPTLDIAETRNLLSAALLSILFHACLHPRTALSSMLLHLGFVFHELLDGVRIGYVAPLLYAGTGGHTLFPGFEGGKLVDVDAGPTCGCDPSVVGDVCEICKLSDAE